MSLPNIHQQCHFSVISETSDTPNFVQLASNGKITCTCKNYRPKKVCSHAIAVAEKENRLNDFVSWYRKQCSTATQASQTWRPSCRPTRFVVGTGDIHRHINHWQGNQFAKWSAMRNVIQLPVAPAPAPAPASATFAPPVVQLHTGFTRSYCAQLPVMGASQTASINPHMAVPPGFPLPPKPPLPHTPNRYFLTKL